MFSDLGLSGDGLGTLLGDPTLSTLLSDLGLGNLDLGSLSLTSILSGLGLDGSVDLNSLSLNTVLGAFGINPTIDLGLSSLLSDLGFGSFVDESLGTVVGSLPSALLTPILSSLNGVLDTLLSPLTAVPGVDTLLTSLGLNLDNLLTVSNLETALNNVTVGDLLGGQSIDKDVSTLLGDLGVAVPGNLTIGGILGDLGFASSTGDLTLSDLLGDLNIDPNVGSLLDTVNLGDLLNDLGLSNTLLTGLPSILDLGDLSNLTLSGLLGDLGLGDLATVSVDPFGGLITELADVVPQQILAAL